MEIKDAIFGRRSVRKYLPQKVEKDKLEYVLDAARYAPSAMNDQSRQFIAITDAKLLRELNAAVEEVSDEATRTRIKGRSENGEFNFFYNAPVLILACDSPAVFRPQEDCACALENMFMAAYDCGLGSCWINQLTDKASVSGLSKILKKIGVKPGYEIYGCAAIGYADGETELTKPKTNEIIIR